MEKTREGWGVYIEKKRDKWKIKGGRRLGEWVGLGWRGVPLVKIKKNESVFWTQQGKGFGHWWIGLCGTPTWNEIEMQCNAKQIHISHANCLWLCRTESGSSTQRLKSEDWGFVCFRLIFRHLLNHYHVSKRHFFSLLSLTFYFA